MGIYMTGVTSSKDTEGRNSQYGSIKGNNGVSYAVYDGGFDSNKTLPDGKQCAFVAQEAYVGSDGNKVQANAKQIKLLE